MVGFTTLLQAGWPRLEGRSRTTQTLNNLMSHDMEDAGWLQVSRESSRRITGFHQQAEEIPMHISVGNWVREVTEDEWRTVCEAFEEVISARVV